MAKCTIDKAFYKALADSYDTVGSVMMSGAKLSSVDRASQAILKSVVSSNMEDTVNADLNEVRNQALSYFYMFGDSQIINDAYHFLENVSYVAGTDLDYPMFVIYSNAVLSNTGVYKKPEVFMVPKNLKHTSSVFAAHEVSHMLKERNPKECMEFLAYGEVIPMLMELIIAYTYEYENTDNILAQRSSLIKGSAQSFREIYKEYKMLADNSDKRTYEAALNESGVYVNSFHYTLALFALFIADKRLVLNMISNVLNCRCSTSDVIRYISQYHIDKLYETGLDEFNYAIK